MTKKRWKWVLTEALQWTVIFTAMDIAFHFFKIHGGILNAGLRLLEKLAVNAVFAFVLMFILACLGWAFGFIKDKEEG